MPNDIDKTRMAQNLAIQELKRAQMSPEQLAEYDSIQKQQMLAIQPNNPLDQRTVVTPEMQAEIIRQAAQNYVSPEAKAMRAKYDVNERMIQQPLAITDLLLKPRNK